MLPDVQLSFQPSIFNCLAWSDDGELAVAAGEFVHILIPRRSHSNQETANDASNPWVQIHIRTNVFAGNEWPLQEPASFTEFSIGEEQSLSNVISLTWSPPGLARNRRTVLAVLTSNLVLSFWASTSDPSVVASWERVYVVNNGIWESLERRIRLGSASGLTDSIFRRLLRIRSVAWAPLLPKKPKYDGTRLTSVFGLFFLAVATDEGSTLFLSVSSPHISGSPYWDARIIRQHNFQEESSMAKSIFATEVVEDETESEASKRKVHTISEYEHIYHRGSLLSVALRAKRFIDHISWGAWLYAESFAEIPINFQNDKTLIAQVKLLVSLDHPQKTFLPESSTSYTTGPFICQHESLELDLLDLPHSTFHKQALQLRARYHRENDYGGLTTLKFWGSAIYKDYAAICVTLHPGDLVDYLLPSEERATILFSVGGTDSLDMKLETFEWEIDPETGETESTHRAILDLIFELERQSNIELGGLSNMIIYGAACASMLLWDSERLQRLSLALSVLERLERRISVNLGSEINACSHLLRASGIREEEAIVLVGEATAVRTNEDLNNASRVFGVCSICAHTVTWQSLFDATCIQGHYFTRCAMSFLAIEEPGISKYCEKCNREFLNEHVLRESEHYPGLLLGPEGATSPKDCPFDENEVVIEQQDSFGQRANVMTKEVGQISKAPSLASMMFDYFDVCPYCNGKFIG